MNEKLINEFGNGLLDLIEKYQYLIPPYEIGHQMISNAVSMLLCTAPNHLCAVKTILACVENGISSHEEFHNGIAAHDAAHSEGKKQ